MYQLLHEKANLLNTIMHLSEDLVRDLTKAKESDSETLDGALRLLQARRGKMDEVDLLSRRIGFLQQSGYTPEPEEAQRIVLEESTITAILNNIQTLEQQGNELISSMRQELLDRMKDVRDGKKSITAYAAPMDEAEGAQLDMRR